MTHMGDLSDETNVIRYSKLGDLSIEMPDWKGAIHTELEKLCIMSSAYRMTFQSTPTIMPYTSPVYLLPDPLVLVLLLDMRFEHSH